MSASSSSSSATTDNKDKDSGSNKYSSDNVLWSNWPSLSIMLPPQGTNARTIDERCFTYCSQTVKGRMSRQDPSCRTVCFRKVFRHEVRRSMSMREMKEAIRNYEREHGNFPEKLDASVEVKYLLPPEGQRTKRESGSISLKNASEDILADDAPFSSSSSKDEDKERNWEPGWYLWSTKSRWAVQEHIDMMKLDLKTQEDWRKYKDQVNKTSKIVNGGFELSDDHVSRKEWYPDITESTLLVPIPPPHILIGTAIHNYLEPTRNLLDILHESINSGHQQDLAKRMLEKAQTPEPWILVRNVCSKMWKILNEGPPDDGEETNKGGKV